MKHMRSIANICNAGISEEQMSEASAQACVTFPSNPWSSVNKGFTAWLHTHLMAITDWLHLRCDLKYQSSVVIYYQLTALYKCKTTKLIPL